MLKKRRDSSKHVEGPVQKIVVAAVNKHFARLSKSSQDKLLTSAYRFLRVDGHQTNSMDDVLRFAWHKITPHMISAYCDYLGNHYQKKTIMLYIMVLKSLLVTIHAEFKAAGYHFALRAAIAQLKKAQKTLAPAKPTASRKLLSDKTIKLLSRPAKKDAQLHDYRDLAYFSLQLHSGLNITVCRRLMIGVKNEFDDALLTPRYDAVSFCTRGGSLVTQNPHRTTTTLLKRWMAKRGGDPGYVIVPLPLTQDLKDAQISYQSAKTLFKNFCNRHQISDSINASQLSMTHKAKFK